MCLSEVIASLRAAGVLVTAGKIRWAISSGKVTRPILDSSLRFSFDEENVAELAAHFASREAVPCS